MADSDDENIALSTSTLSALQEFYSERDARAKQFEDLKAISEQKHDDAKKQKLSMDAFAEDWNESQFWYSDETATELARELLDGATNEDIIAVVSAPSVFVQLKNLLNESHSSEDQKPTIYLLEYDRRFEVFSEFVYYDFNKPFTLPPNLKGTITRFIVDPPFLSEDCQTRAALTVRWLSSIKVSPPRIIVCTGERMETLITKLYSKELVRTTTFEPVHSKGLSNEFFCYANFKSEKWQWRTSVTNADADVETS